VTEADDSLLEKDEPKYTISIVYIADNEPLIEEEIDFSLVDNNLNESSTAQSELEIPTSVSTSDDATIVTSTMEPVTITTTTTRQAFVTSTPDIRDSPTTDTLLVTEEPKANISTVL
jgi:hypothetical protein